MSRDEQVAPDVADAVALGVAVLLLVFPDAHVVVAFVDVESEAVFGIGRPGVFGVDVSTYQKTMKFENTPAKFAIIRAGYTSRSTGTQNKDNAFEDLYSQAKAEGLNVGVYWYSLAKSAEDAIAEAGCVLK